MSFPKCRFLSTFKTKQKHIQIIHFLWLCFLFFFVELKNYRNNVEREIWKFILVEDFQECTEDMLIYETWFRILGIQWKCCKDLLCRLEKENKCTNRERVTPFDRMYWMRSKWNGMKSTLNVETSTISSPTLKTNFLTQKRQKFFKSLSPMFCLKKKWCG